MLGGSVASSIEDGLDKMARDARTVLLAIAALNLGGAALLWIAGGVPDVSAVIPQIVTGIAFGALGVWARRSPMLPVAIGVAIYALGLVATLLTNPLAVLSMWGLILHGILIVLCFNGVSSALNYNKLKRQFEDKLG